MATWFITGGGRGLGAALARTALDAGADVALGVRDPGRLPADLADRAFAVTLDVTRSRDIPAAVDSVIQRFGGIDVLVNNAGRGLLGAMEELTDTEVRSLFDVNVFGLINLTREVLPHMRAAGGGKLVHIGSRGGFEGEPGVGAYCASKFAVAGISEALSAELAPFGIQSMVVEPGVFRTDFLDESSLAVPAHRLAAYRGTPAHDTLVWARDANHAQLGDPVKGAELIYQVTGQATLPRHLLLGRDAVDRWQVKAAQMAVDIAAWRDASLATAHSD